MAAKRKVKQTLEEQESGEMAAEVPMVSTTPEQTKKSSLFSKKTFVILFILIIAGAGLYFLRQWLVVAEVNGQPISRLELYQQLEMQAGQQVLNGLIAKTLIVQEAENKKITVSQKEIDDRVKQLEKVLSKQGETIDQYLKAKRMSKQTFLEEVRIQVIIEKLLGKKIAVSDKEVNEYIEQNKEALPEGVKPEEIKEQVKQELQNQKVQMEIPNLLQDLQKKAKITREIKASTPQ